MQWSIGVPSLAVRRYFLSQMSRDASWNGMLRASRGSIFTAVLIAATRLRFHLHLGGTDNPPGRQPGPVRVRCDTRLTADMARLGWFQSPPGNASCRTQHVGSGRKL